MKPEILNRFREGTRGQAYTLESILAVVLIVTVVLFIAPSFATPTSNADTTQAREHAEVEESVEAMLDRHTENGHLKSLLLNYEGNSWRVEEPTNRPYQYAPHWGNGSLAIPGGTDENGTEYKSRYFRPPGPVGASIQDIEDEHDVVISMYLLPESTASEGESPNRTIFVYRGEGPDAITVETTTLTLYDDDRLRSPAVAHTRDGTALPQHAGEGPRLVDASNFPIEEMEDHSAPGSVYNTVTVQVVVHENTEDE